MKLKVKITLFLCSFFILVLSVGCPLLVEKSETLTGWGSAESIPVSFQGATPLNGTAGVSDTTQIELDFDVDPISLALSNISITGATPTGLSGSGLKRTLTISGISVNIGDSITVIVSAPIGYEITPSSQSLIPIRGPEGISFSALQCVNGTSLITDTTQLRLVFSEYPVGLGVGHIDINGATAVTLARDGTTNDALLTISNITVPDGDNVTVTINSNPTGYSGLENAARSVAVFRAAINVQFTSVVPRNGTQDVSDTTELTLAFSEYPLGLTASNISVLGATAETLSRDGTTNDAILIISNIEPTIIQGETLLVTVDSTPAGYPLIGIDEREVTVNRQYYPGRKNTFSLNGISFTGIYIPEGVPYFGGVDGTTYGSTIGDADAWMGETEVTYELWQAVYDWATTTGGYNFTNSGQQGISATGGPGATNQHPVINISFADAVVWCNALTEYYNIQNSTSYECVYTESSVPLRDSTNLTAVAAVTADGTAKGFRLYNLGEWAIAAHFIKDINRNGSLREDVSSTEYYPGDFATGADIAEDGTPTADQDGDGDMDAVADVAAYGNYTAPVKSKNPNKLGFYDLSGNVREWGFFAQGGGDNRLHRGGSWNDTPTGNLRLGARTYADLGTVDDYTGFRIVKDRD